MNFKEVTILFLISITMGCSDFINGQKREDKVLTFKGDRFACLSKVPEALRTILDESSSPEKLEETLRCLESSLTYFKMRTKGNVPNGYSIRDVRAFFGNYLGDKDRVTDEMASELMKIKKALFGGNEQVIAKIELQALIDLTADIRQEINLLSPYWSTVLIKSENRPSKDMLLQSHNALKESLMRLVLKTDLVRSDYSFVNFQSFMREIEAFVRRSKSRSGLIQFNKWLSIFEYIKVHLFGDRTDMGSIDKWKDAISQVLELHHIYSIYYYKFKGHDLFSREGFEASDEMIVLGINLLNKSWLLNRGGIPFSDTFKLLEVLEKQKVLPQNMTAPALFQAYQVIIRNFLDRSGGNIKALLPQHILALKNEYQGFKVVQNFIDTLPPVFSYEEMLKVLDKNKIISVNTFPDASEEFINLSWRDWQSHIRQEHPIIYLKSGELLLDKYVKDSTQWSWYGLSRLNVMKFLNRVLMLGFGVNHNIDLKKEFLNEDSLIKFYRDFWDLGVELKAFDKRTGNSGRRTYFEADHFVYSGNGNGAIDSQESFELLNIVFSAGLSGVSQIQKDLSMSNCALPDLDDFGNQWLDEICFKRVLRLKFGTYFKNLPGLSGWVKSLNDQGWDAFYHELIGFSRFKPNTVGRIETGDLRTLVVISHYIESMFIKFDTDEDDRLSVNELIEGSRRFTPFFKELFTIEPKGPFLRETQENLIDYALSRAFACMVMTGEMPKMIKSCTPAFFKDAVMKKSYSDRTQILRTLNALKTAIK